MKKKNDGVPEIGKKEKGVEGTFNFKFMRDKIMGKVDKEIRTEIGNFLVDVGHHLYKLIMMKKKEWEEEEERIKKFIGDSGNGDGKKDSTH